MRKIFTILVAVMLVATSAMAQKKIQANGVNNSKLAKAVTAVHKKDLKLQKTNHDAKFTQAAKQTYNCVCTQINSAYYQEDNDWYIEMTCNEGLFCFDIVADSIIPGVTYTISDMLADYTCYSSDGQYVSWFAAAATYQKVIDSLGHEHIYASMTDSTGDIYNITYDAPFRPDSFTDVNATCTLVKLLDYTATDSVFQFQGFNDSLTIYIAATAVTIPGTYYFNDIMSDYTALAINGNAIQFDSLKFEVTASANAGEYDATAYIGAFNGIHYTITMNYRIPTAQDTVNFVATNLSVTHQSFYGFFEWYEANAYNEDNYIEFEANAIGDTIDAANVTLADIVAGELVELSPYSGNVVLHSMESVTGSILCYNNTLYNITLTFTAPEAQDTIDINNLTDVSFNDYADLDGSYQFIGVSADESNQVGVNYFANTVTGSYTFADCDPGYSWIMYEGTEQTIYSGNFTVTEADGNYNVEGYFLCLDNNVYHFAMSYAAPEPPVAEDTIRVVYTNAQLVDYVASSGICQFVGANADSTDLAYIAYYCSAVAGTYTEADLYTQYSIIVMNNQEIEIASCNFNVIELDGGYQLHGYFLCEDNHCYELYISTSTNTQGISNVQIAEVSVYPNPFSSKLNVMAEGVKEVQVIDMMGQVVVRQANAGIIDMSSLSNGAYIVRTVTEKGINVQKVIKK